MVKTQILEKISKTGRFVYAPDLWCPQADEAIEELIREGKIRISKEKEEPMNWGYIYRLQSPLDLS